MLKQFIKSLVELVQKKKKEGVITKPKKDFVKLTATFEKDPQGEKTKTYMLHEDEVILLNKYIASLSEQENIYSIEINYNYIVKNRKRILNETTNIVL